jgi:hypothetical protein
LSLFNVSPSLRVSTIAGKSAEDLLRLKFDQTPMTPERFRDISSDAAMFMQMMETPVAPTKVYQQQRKILAWWWSALDAVAFSVFIHFIMVSFYFSYSLCLFLLLFIVTNVD